MSSLLDMLDHVEVRASSQHLKTRVILGGDFNARTFIEGRRLRGKGSTEAVRVGEMLSSALRARGYQRTNIRGLSTFDGCWRFRGNRAARFNNGGL